MSGDYLCLVVGIMAVVFSIAGGYAIKVLRNRKERRDFHFDKKQKPHSSVTSDKTQKTLKFQALPSLSSKQVQDKKNHRESMSSPVQNFNAIKSTSGMPDSGPKEAEVTLDIRKIKDTEKFDVALDIIVDPDSSKPLNAKVYAQVDKDTMDVCGKAQSEADGFVRIEGQARGKNYEKKAMNLKTNIKNMSGESHKMCLRSGRKIKK